MIIDTHAHYDDEAFDDDRDELLRGLNEKNIELVVNASANIKECEATLKLMDKYPFVYGMIGVHPSEVGELDEKKFEWMKNICIERSVLSGGKVVSVGEIGLDYYYEDTRKEEQKIWFERQIELAREVKLPINIHSRDAAKDTLDILKEHKASEIGGIVHCYSYSKEVARDILDMGFLFGIGGVVTFKNAKKLVEVVEFLPIEAIVLETDCPYLAPVPFRGQRNDSGNLNLVAEKIAEIKEMSIEEVIARTSENARKVYRINANVR